MAPNVYGAGHFRKAGSPGNQFDFLQQFRANGGAAVRRRHEGAASPRTPGVKTLQQHDRSQRGLDPRQQRARRRLALGGVPDRQGGDDLLVAAVGTHGGELLAKRQRRSTSSRSRRSPARSAMRSCRAIRSTPPASTRRWRQDSANPEAAYLFMQWVTSPPVSLARVHAALCAARSVSALALQVGALRRACSRARRSTWYNLNNSANVGLLDPIMPGAQDYFLSLDRMATDGVGRRRSGRTALKTAAAEWDDDHRAARRRIAEGVLPGVPEAARARPPTTRSRSSEWRSRSTNGLISGRHVRRPDLLAPPRRAHR